MRAREKSSSPYEEVSPDRGRIYVYRPRFLCPLTRERTIPMHGDAQHRRIRTRGDDNMGDKGPGSKSKDKKSKKKGAKSEDKKQ